MIAIDFSHQRCKHGFRGSLCTVRTCAHWDHVTDDRQIVKAAGRCRADQEKVDNRYDPEIQRSAQYTENKRKKKPCETCFDMRWRVEGSVCKECGIPWGSERITGEILKCSPIARCEEGA